MADPRHGTEWFSKNLIDVLPSAVYVCDLGGVIVAFNERATDIWGRTPTLGQTDERFCGSHRLFKADGTYMPHDQTPMAITLLTGAPAPDVEAIIEQPNGKRVPVLVNIAPLFDDDGKQIGAVNCFQDLSAQKQHERDRLDLAEALRQSQKVEAMGQLVGGVAHDFNNLLTPILGVLDILHRRGGHEPRETRLIDAGLQSAERAKLLVQRLLAFARRQPLQVRPIDVASLLTDLSDLVAGVTGPDITLIMDFAADLPLAKVDPNQLEMAILNLAVNARDAMPDPGTLTISGDRESVHGAHRANLTPGEYLHLSVADTGVGMDEATIARALEPFFTTKEIGKGTGLGLSMAEGLAAQLGGALFVSSILGTGTTIEIWLPATQALLAEKLSRNSPAETSLHGRVLLVDDEPIVRMSTADMLADIGYDVVEAASAEEALLIIENGQHFDLLITDHVMPGMTGADLIGTVRASRPAIPALIITGFANADTIPASQRCLAKPFRQSDLISILQPSPLSVAEIARSDLVAGAGQQGMAQ
jgi:PAS domain S-box-containing protein